MKARTQNWFPRQCLSTYRKCKLVESEKANALHTFEAQSPNTQKKLSAHKESAPAHINCEEAEKILSLHKILCAPDS